MIKPYIDFHIDMRNLTCYRNFLKKKPKIAIQFKFKMIPDELELTRVDEKRVQLKLLTTLKTLKSISKVDLGKCEITDYGFWEQKLLSAWKTISHIKTLFIMGPKSGSQLNYFKYFPKLKKVFYKLNSDSFDPDYDNLDKTEEPSDTHHDLKSLKYCPKIRSLDFADSSDDYYSPKVFVEANSYLRSLESLVLNGGGLSEDQFKFPLESCKNLRSISLQFPRIRSWKSLPQILDLLSKQANLQEMRLSLITNLSPDFLEAFKKITSKGMLQKVGFEFEDAGWFDIEKLLNALKTCKLTCFSLKARLQDVLAKALSQFIKSMDHLESLQLHFLNHFPDPKDENLMELCKQISQLQALRNLKLCFPTPESISKKTTISNFIPSLFNAFSKPVKIETFHLECEQLDPSEAFQSLVSILGNSPQYLTRLKINVGTLPCTDQTSRSILKLMQSILNIQVLEIPCLTVSGLTSGFLDEITEAVQRLKYLRVFEIGEIKDIVAPLDLLNAVEVILRKRGLRHFGCQLSSQLQENLRNEEDLDLDRIFQENPYFESFSPFDFDIDDWIED